MHHKAIADWTKRSRKSNSQFSFPLIWRKTGHDNPETKTTTEHRGQRPPSKNQGRNNRQDERTRQNQLNESNAEQRKQQQNETQRTPTKCCQKKSALKNERAKKSNHQPTSDQPTAGTEQRHENDQNQRKKNDARDKPQKKHNSFFVTAVLGEGKGKRGKIINRVSDLD